MKKLLVSILTITILTLTHINPKISHESTYKSNIMPVPFIVETKGEYVTLCVENSEDVVITVDVEKDQVESFVVNFSAGKVQIPAEIFSAFDHNNSNISPMAFIPSSNAKLNSEQKLYKSDIERTVKSYAGIATWAGAVLINTVNSWWTTSYVMIMNNEIRYVRQALYENTGTGYPVAWRICERIK